ncbi:MAG: hypothetical protein R3200_05695 [Xanthomonadales bacterium]|nr:hypothetical protein [Xanthomonadales bacterium]
MSARLHEDYGREAALEPGSPRAFGIVMAIAIPLLTLIFLRNWWMAGLVLGGGFLVTAFSAPRILEPLNRQWFRLGMLLSRIVAPIVMGILYFLIVTPIGLLRRMLRKRSFPTGFDPSLNSYWEEREPPGPDPGGLPRQF